MDSLFWIFSGGEVKDNSSLVSVVSSSLSTEEDRYDTFLHTGKFAKLRVLSYKTIYMLYRFEIEKNKSISNSWYFVKFQAKESVFT